MAVGEEVPAGVVLADLAEDLPVVAVQAEVGNFQEKKLTCCVSLLLCDAIGDAGSVDLHDLGVITYCNAICL